MSDAILADKIPTNSSLHYSLRKVPLAKRQAVRALFTWFLTLEKLIDSSDLSIAEKSFTWWQQELELGWQAKHPLNQQLAQLIAQYQLPQSTFVAILTALQDNLTVVSYADESAHRRYATSTLARLNHLVAQVLLDLPPSPQEATVLQHISYAMHWMRCVAHLHHDGQRGHVYLPSNRLADYGILPQHLLNPSLTPEGLKLYLRASLHPLKAQLMQINTLPIFSRRALNPLFVLALLNWQTHQATAKDDFRVLERKTTPSPLSKLMQSTWDSWRIILGQVRLK